MGLRICGNELKIREIFSLFCRTNALILEEATIFMNNLIFREKKNKVR